MTPLTRIELEFPRIESSAVLNIEIDRYNFDYVFGPRVWPALQKFIVS